MGPLSLGLAVGSEGLPGAPQRSVVSALGAAAPPVGPAGAPKAAFRQEVCFAWFVRGPMQMAAAQRLGRRVCFRPVLCVCGIGCWLKPREHGADRVRTRPC